MSPNRFNIFNQIHKGLRAMLYELALEIQQTDFCEVEEAESLVKEVEQVVSFFTAHAEHEDRFILPAVAKHNARIIEAFAHDHLEDGWLANLLLKSVQAWRVAADAPARMQAGSELFYHFTEFTAFNLVHMNKEERFLNEVLWQYYSDAELFEIERCILASVPPEILAVESRWMMRGLSNPEIIAWLRGVKQAAPEALFFSFLNLAEEELPEGRWKAINAALVDGRLVA
jgi:hypothetical protein